MNKLLFFCLALCFHLGVLAQSNIFDAARSGDTLSIKSMILADSDTVNALNPSGHSPLILAAYNNQVQVCKLLIIHGADVNYTFSQGAAIHGAAFKGNLGVITHLVSNGADYDKPDQNGSTPLIYATIFGHNEVAKYLFHLGCDPTKKDGTGSSAMDYAESLGNNDLLTLFNTKIK